MQDTRVALAQITCQAGQIELNLKKHREGTVNLASVERDLGRIGGRCPDDFRRTSPLTKQRRNGPAAFGGWRVAADAVRP